MTSTFVFNGESLTELGYPPGFLFGLTLSNNGSDATNDIDIAAGKCRDSTAAQNMVLASALTKRLDAAWAVGTNQGGLDTGSIADGTYHIWLIKRSDTGVVDALFSASASSPTMPANYDYKRRIGSIVRASGAIRGFQQIDDRFLWTGGVTTDLNGGSATTYTNVTLTVPAGIKVRAVCFGQIVNASATPILNVKDPDITGDIAAYIGYGAANGVYGSGMFEMETNTSAQIQYKASQASSTVYIYTHGWYDTRGRLS